jgi:putative signal transducing protein
LRQKLGKFVSMKSESTDLVTLTTVSDPIQASLMKGRLEAEGIICYLADQNTIGINPLYSNALGGVRLQVRQCDREEARKVLSLDDKA